MTNKEIALELTKKNMDYHKYSQAETIRIYRYFLEELEKPLIDNKYYKIKEKIEKFNCKMEVSVFEYYNLIDEINEIINDEKIRE